MTACHTLSYCYFQLQWEAATSYTTVTATCYDSLPHPQLLLLPVAMKGRHLYSTYCYCHMLWKPATFSAIYTFNDFQWGTSSVTVTDTYNCTMDFWHLLCFCIAQCNESPRSPALFSLSRAMKACLVLCQNRDCQVKWKPAASFATLTKLKACHLLPLGKSDIHFFFTATLLRLQRL